MINLLSLAPGVGEQSKQARSQQHNGTRLGNRNLLDPDRIEARDMAGVIGAGVHFHGQFAVADLGRYGQQLPIGASTLCRSPERLSR